MGKFDALHGKKSDKVSLWWLVGDFSAPISSWLAACAAWLKLKKFRLSLIRFEDGSYRYAAIAAITLSHKVAVFTLLATNRTEASWSWQFDQTIQN